MMMQTSNTKTIRNRKQKGFTLIELTIVIAILGIVMAIVVNAVRGSSDSANATAITSSSTQLAKAIGYIHAQLGTGLSATANAITNPAGGNMMPVLMEGRSAVLAAYQPRFDQIQMRPLGSDYKRTGTAAPYTYNLLNYPVTFVSSGCPVGSVCVQYSNVPEEVAAVVYTKMTGKVLGSTAQTLDNGLVVSAATNGLRTLTLHEIP